MTIYVRNCDNEEITTVEVDEKFKEVIEENDFEGFEWYEDIADELREIIEEIVANPVEAYENYNEAKMGFAPILCW